MGEGKPGAPLDEEQVKHLCTTGQGSGKMYDYREERLPHVEGESPGE